MWTCRGRRDLRCRSAAFENRRDDGLVSGLVDATQIDYQGAFLSPRQDRGLGSEESLVEVILAVQGHQGRRDEGAGSTASPDGGVSLGHPPIEALRQVGGPLF